MASGVYIPVKAPPLSPEQRELYAKFVSNLTLPLAQVGEKMSTWKENTYKAGEVYVHECTGYKMAPGVAYLPHQCDEWRVGGRAEVEQLIADLQALLPKLQERR